MRDSAGLDRGSDCIWHQLNGEEERVDNETANLEFTSIFGQCLLFWWSSTGHRLERSRV